MYLLNWGLPVLWNCFGNKNNPSVLPANGGWLNYFVYASHFLPSGVWRIIWASGEVCTRLYLLPSGVACIFIWVLLTFASLTWGLPVVARSPKGSLTRTCAGWVLSYFRSARVALCARIGVPFRGTPASAGALIFSTPACCYRALFSSQKIRLCRRIFRAAPRVRPFLDRPKVPPMLGAASDLFFLPTALRAVIFIAFRSVCFCYQPLFAQLFVFVHK
jgi:hypothetical protein